MNDTVRTPTGQQRNRTSAAQRAADNGKISQEQANEMRFIQDAAPAEEDNSGTIFDGKNNHDTENLSDISQEDQDNLKKYVYTTVKAFEYPLRLGESTNNSEPEHLHSVRFTALARENSRVALATNSAIDEENKSWFGSDYADYGVSGSLEAVDRTEQNRLSAEQAGALALLSGGAAGAALGVKLAGKIGEGTNAIGSTLGFIGGAGAGVGLAAGVVERVRTVRTLGLIDLYISQPPIARYSANWENKELGALAGAAGAVTDAIQNSDMSQLLSAGTGVGELGIRSAIKAAASLPSSLGITGEIGAGVDLASGKTPNPYKEQLFTSMGFRQFAFNYKFAPRNNAEYENVKRIIELFKYHMHPENDPTGLFLEYPSEFEIEYCYRGDINPHLNKISSCALTDMKITYGNQDAFTTILNTGGVPAEINVELAFTELETLTNNRIADGF